ncbi:HAD-IIIC family phosphatase [Nakamurella sp. YIM 132087]|uniref:HAD-IIIC family phosphatase n=1 Tax=Nakamurella alba TaxID=2665158 RepID=A0A7K1FPR3_9ACTN|nr:HAD-IIIC family phosphatase [Nakamurella alba]MTD15349.1 HAD-IIIC family phosphatase [Nakamurella alba]
MTETLAAAPEGAGVDPTVKPRRGRIKCIVWDLDHTLWDGVLLEDDAVHVRESVVAHIERLDRMGVLHSLASRNDEQAAMDRLRELGLDRYFLAPQITWDAKSGSIRRIAAALNLGLDAFAFVDDQPFELAEVSAALPEVTVVHVDDVDEALQRDEFRPRFVTDESARRREMYAGQLLRDDLEKEFVGTNDEFLAGLSMQFVIEQCRQEDLQRAEELTVRTNQLNATGRTFSYEELDELRTSDDHLLLVASLTDRFGSYGKIGLALVEKSTTAWHLRMMLMSCRVMSRGVGMVLLNHLMGSAAGAGVPLRADFVETGRNRMMQITYAFAGFREVERDGNRVVLQADGDPQPAPAWVDVQVIA